MTFETILDNDSKDHFDEKQMFRISLALIAEVNDFLDEHKP